jgi:hypothetical protein
MNNHNLYVIQSGEYIKLGYSINIPKRMISYKTHNPSFKLLHTFHRNDAKLFEKWFHKEYRKHRKLEWYSKSFLNTIVEKCKKQSEIVIEEEPFRVYSSFMNILISEKLRRAALRVFAWILQNYSSLSSDISIVKHIKDKIAFELGLSPVSIKEYLKELENEDMLIKTGRACFKLNPKYVWQGSSDKRDLAINVLIKEGKFEKMYPDNN